MCCRVLQGVVVCCSVLQCRHCQIQMRCMANFGKKRVSPGGKIGIWNCAAVLFSQVPKLCTDLDLSLRYILTQEHIANSLANTISWRSAFAFRNPARAMAAGLPRQDHVDKTTDELFCFHNKKFDEMRCKLNFTENPGSFLNPKPHDRSICHGRYRRSMLTHLLQNTVDIYSRSWFTYMKSRLISQRPSISEKNRSKSTVDVDSYQQKIGRPRFSGKSKKRIIDLWSHRW